MSSYSPPRTEQRQARCRRRHMQVDDTGEHRSRALLLDGSRSGGGADRVSADTSVSSKASATAAQHARSLLHQCRRRLPGAHRRRDVAERVRNRCWRRRDSPAGPALVLAYGAEHVPRIRGGVRHGPRPDAGSRCGACPGRGILGPIRVVPDSAPSLGHITGRVLRATARRDRRRRRPVTGQMPASGSRYAIIWALNV
jgi:hypothetical protein